MSRVYFYDGVCPYCKLNVNFRPIRLKKENRLGEDYAFRSLNIEKNLMYLAEIHLSDKDNYPTKVNIVTCDHCKKTLSIFLEKFSDDRDKYDVRFTYPIISKIDKPEGVSQRIWDDYVEAMICLGVNAPKGAVVLLRRATQSLMKELGANPKDKLATQIEDLKNDGLITEGLYQLATEIRHWGNFGAHPDDDLLDEVTNNEAKDMKKVFDLLLEFTVIQKAKIKVIQEKRKKKKK